MAQFHLWCACLCMFKCLYPTMYLMCNASILQYVCACVSVRRVVFGVSGFLMLSSGFFFQRFWNQYLNSISFWIFKSVFCLFVCFCTSAFVKQNQETLKFLSILFNVLHILLNLLLLMHFKCLVVNLTCHSLPYIFTEVPLDYNFSVSYNCYNDTIMSIDGVDELKN